MAHVCAPPGGRTREWFGLFGLFVWFAGLKEGGPVPYVRTRAKWDSPTRNLSVLWHVLVRFRKNYSPRTDVRHERQSLLNKPAVVLGSGQGGPTDLSTTQPRVRPTLGPPDCAPAAVIGWRSASPEAAADTSELSRVRSSEKTGGGRIFPARHRASRSFVRRCFWKFLEVSAATPTRE